MRLHLDYAGKPARTIYYSEEENMRIVAFSDLHGTQNEVLMGRHVTIDIPDGDILICAGDFCNSGSLDDVISFNKWFFQLPHRRKIVIAGNHDRIFEEDPYTARLYLNDDIVYLQDESKVIDGIRFHGMPWTLPFNNWAFMAGEEFIDHKLSRLPDWKSDEAIDVLISHGPACGILDRIPNKSDLGSKSLYKHIDERIRPKLSIFGHIHASYGHYKGIDTDFYNVSLLNENYDLVNKPVIYDL